jgi:hypothetical protein
MSEWMTITILESGLAQRVRKSSISTYGTNRNLVYVVKDGRLVNVAENENGLKAELEGDEV